MMERFFFGNTFRYKTKDQKIKCLKTHFYLITICFFIVFAGFVYMSYLYYDIMSPILFEEDAPLSFTLENPPKIIFDNVDNKTKEKIENILSAIKPECFYQTKKIIFTSNLSYLKEKCSIPNCIGVNLQNGKEIIIYTKGKYLENTITHELLHTLMIRGPHKLIYDLADKGICYKEDRIEWT